MRIPINHFYIRVFSVKKYVYECYCERNDRTAEHTQEHRTGTYTDGMTAPHGHAFKEKAISRRMRNSIGLHLYLI